MMATETDQDIHKNESTAATNCGPMVPSYWFQKSSINSQTYKC